jgi:hypothetical protein
MGHTAYIHMMKTSKVHAYEVFASAYIPHKIWRHRQTADIMTGVVAGRVQQQSTALGPAERELTTP